MRALVVGLCVGGGLFSCAGSTSTPGAADDASVYVGTASDDDGDVSVAFAVQGDRVVGYACADDVTREAYPGWFTGQALPDGRFHLERDGWSFQGSTTGSAAAGTIVEPDGAVLHWSSVRVKNPGLSGLYAVNDSGCVTGVIVLDNGPSSSPTVRGAWCDAKSRVRQVCPTFPLQLDDGRLAVELCDERPRRFFVAPVHTASLLR